MAGLHIFHQGNVMKKTLLATLILLAPAVSSAAIVTYTDESAFLAAAGALETYDFNSEVDEVFDTKAFDGFSATLVDGVGGFKPVTLQDELYIQVRDADSLLNIDFDYDTASFGFDWKNTDKNGDSIEVEILGQTFVFGFGQSSGFFGVISDTAFKTASFSGDDGGFGDLGHASLDNFKYSAVPVPAAAMLFAPAVLGFMGLRRKAKQA
jgi:hypothetical protein